MKRQLTFLSFLFCSSAVSLLASYSYYGSDNLQSYNNSAPNWYINGSSSNSAQAGLTASTAGGASYITHGAPPDGSNQYEVAMTTTLSAGGGTYVIYLEATSNALLGSTSTGSFYAFAIQNPAFSNNSCSAAAVLYKVVSGSVSQISSTTVPCGPTVTYHAILGTDSALHFWVNGLEYITWSDSQTPLSGAGGIGGYSMPAGNGISLVQLGACDRIAPGTVDSSSGQTFALVNDVDIETAGVVDDTNGSGVMGYRWSRDGVYLATTLTPELRDAGASSGSTHSYTVQSQDHHGNRAAVATLSVPIATNATIDPRRVGVRPTGSYWGGTGEQIDTRSGNMNFTIPMLQAQSRGWSVPVSLVYNSQNWRLDTAGKPWKLGDDVGYGFGWKLQIGSLTPFFSSYFSVAYYQFVDASGATYRLNQNNGGIWTSAESVYVTYDSNAQLLHFNNGSFWVLGCTSAGTEQDAGVMYPTLIEDSNGNQIIIGYAAGNNVSWLNSSARLASLMDVRGGSNPSSPTYSFNYNTDSVPHLTGFSNTISTAERFTFSYGSPATLKNPFGASSSISFGTAVTLTSANNGAVGTTTSFTYDPSGSGELTQVTLPYGGHLRWQYQTSAYTQSSVREVANRYLQWDSTIGERTYAFTVTPASSGNIPQSRQVVDQTAAATKAWQFSQTQNFTLGLATSYTEGSTGSNAKTLRQTNYTWSQDPANNAYVGRLQVVSDPGMSYQVTQQTDQTVDAYGNVTQTKLYDYSNLTNPSKTYNTSYLTASNGTNYISLYLCNLAASVTVTDVNNNTTTLQQNTYDQYGTAITSTPGIQQQDTSVYGPSYLTRGNVTGQTVAGTSWSSKYDQTGTAIWTGQTINSNHYASFSNTSSTNYAAPSLMTTGNSLTTSFSWSAALGMTSQTGANSDQNTTVYDSAGRPQTVTNPFGGNWTYSYSVSAPQITATSNNHWVKTYLDGLGRTTMVQKGDTANTYSTVQTIYDSCGCTPIGKPWKVSMPYAPGATPVWKISTYDAIGRMLTSVAPDGASTTTSAYAGNSITTTDPAGKWKQFTSDAYGRLIQVTEQSPNSNEPNHVTLYTYDVLDHLLQARMDRTVNGQVTSQYRTWSYDPTTQLLTGQTFPESGTTSYTYNADSTLNTVTDAKSQQKVYSYDTYGRVIQIARGTLANGQFTENTAQRTTFTYDGTNGGFSSNTAGRVSLVNYAGPHGLQFAEMYNYHAAGAVTGKRLNMSGTPLGSNTATLEADYTYNGDGNLATMQYPFSQWSNGSVISGGMQYSFGYDSMSRPSNMINSGNQYVVSSVSYGAADQILQLNATAFTETRTYNANLQLTELVSGTSLHLKYNFSATQNNGRIQSQTDVISGETVAYTYDSLNRLVNASGSGDPSGSWSQAFTYDGFGNLTQKSGSNAPNNLFLATNPANNRLTANGAGYDSNGNLSAYGTGSYAVSYSYDIENRMMAAIPGGTAQTLFSYDQSNQRVYQGTYNTSTAAYSNEQIYFYGADGKKLVAYSLSMSSGNPTLSATQTKIWFAGRIVTPQDRIQSQGKYFPYGEDRYSPSPANPANDTEKFATYTRDSATGLDYAYQRYYNSSTGRFYTSDPLALSAVTNAPQTWNRYSYANGDVANYYDPTGLVAERDPDFYTSTEESNLLVYGWISAYEFLNGASSSGGGSQKAAQVGPAFAAAEALLLKKDCAAFLGAGVVDPHLFLQDLGINGAKGKDGSITFAGLVNNVPGTTLSATTAVASYQKVDIGNSATKLEASTVTITLNTSSGTFTQGNVKAQAITLLHELGHAIYDLFGPLGTGQLGSSYPIQPDSSSVTASEANTSAVQKHCN